MGEWRYSSTILDLGTRWRWVVSSMSLPLYPWRNSPWYPLDRRPRGLQSHSVCCGEKENLLSLLGVEPWPSSLQPATIPTELVIVFTEWMTHLALIFVIIRCTGLRSWEWQTYSETHHQFCKKKKMECEYMSYDKKNVYSGRPLLWSLRDTS
jgi:hypothetical protein